MTWYRQRDLIIDDISHLSWPPDGIDFSAPHLRWEGRVIEIHEGGEHFGSSAAIFHTTRTDVDFDDDVPTIDFPMTDEGVSFTTTTKKFDGKKLYRVLGELWREEWISPAIHSPRVRDDDSAPTASFIVDASGKRETRDTLKVGGRWLWFKPELVLTLLKFRDGRLRWHTKQTGSVGVDSASAVHFGINPLGLLNVYAKDVACLPEWQQQVWAGFNVSPDGGVSKELLDAQAVGRPADTQAPEAFIADGLMQLDKALKSIFGISAFRPHADIEKIINKCHRFRAITPDGLLELAKDLARLTADSIDAVQLQSVVAPPAKEKWGSLKSLEKVIAAKVGDKIAHEIAGPLFGVYDLRLADAHLPSKQLSDALKLLCVDSKANGVIQGEMMLYMFVSSLFAMKNAVGGRLGG